MSYTAASKRQIRLRSVLQMTIKNFYCSTTLDGIFYILENKLTDTPLRFGSVKAIRKTLSACANISYNDMF